MKYVLFTLVDSKSNISLFKEVGSYGPTFPEGLTPVFSVSSSVSTSTPLFYSYTNKPVDPNLAIEVPKEEFIRAFKVEVSKEIKNKRQLLFESSFLVGNTEYPNATYYIQELTSVLTLSLSRIILEVKELEYIELSIVEALKLYSTINLNNQAIHSRTMSFLYELQLAKSTKDISNLRKKIAAVKLEDLV